MCVWGGGGGGGDGPILIIVIIIPGAFTPADRIGFGLNSNLPSRGGLRKDSDWIRSNVNAIRLEMGWLLW